MPDARLASYRRTPILAANGDTLHRSLGAIVVDTVAVRFRMQSFVELLFDDVNEIH